MVILAVGVTLHMRENPRVGMARATPLITLVIFPTIRASANLSSQQRAAQGSLSG